MDAAQYSVVPVHFLRDQAFPNAINVLPGVVLRPLTGRLKAAIDSVQPTAPRAAQQPGLFAKHAIVIDREAYLAALDTRLKSEGSSRPGPPDGWPDVPDERAIVRQVLVALLLSSREVHWAYRGDFYLSMKHGHYTCHGHGHHQHVTGPYDAAWRSPPAGWFIPPNPAVFRRTAAALDAYYRTGSWWWDRLSVALGYLWGALESRQTHLSFVSLSMSLEAICLPGRQEISHQLATRCALLAETDSDKRIVVYRSFKQLYGMRSSIVHGNPGLKIGKAITSNTLFIGAKHSNAPAEQLFEILGLTIRVLNGVIADERLMKILRLKQKEEDAQKQIDDYFLLRTLGST